MTLMENDGDREAKRAVGERSEAAAGCAAPVGVPDPELAERPKRRRFSAEYKLAIVRETDAATKPGEIGALLRREGLYSSLLTEWRRGRDSGALEALAPKRRGRRRPSPEQLELGALQSRLDRTEAELGPGSAGDRGAGKRLRALGGAGLQERDPRRRRDVNNVASKSIVTRPGAPVSFHTCSRARA